ncbi:hypothetical protein [Ferrovibrio sp.]|uniref:hypothetical protein n=1 Tax=Ferrovibrio sp. TaxID=1917215 RepID=UPI0035AEB305
MQKDIWDAAGMLIQEHGERAAMVAQQRANELGEMGDVAGQKQWIQIMKAAASMIDVPTGVPN